MFPRILDFEVMGLKLGVNSYGFMAAVGYLIAIYLCYRQSKRLGMNADAMLDLAFWILVASLLGSRVMYVVANWPRFARDPKTVFWVWEGGLVFYGGLIGALAAGAVVVRMKRLNYLQAADVIAPVLSLGHAFGRIGCFAVGCCWGKVCNCAWGARFGPGSVAYQDKVSLGQLDPLNAAATPPLHPVQLYEACGELAIFAFLLRVAGRKRFNGHVIFVYVMAYSALRLVTEVFRDDPTRKYVVQWATPMFNGFFGLGPARPSFLSTSQLFSLVALPLVFALFWYLRRRAKAATLGTDR